MVIVECTLKQMDEQSTSASDTKTAEIQNGEHTEQLEARHNGHQKILQRLATVPDIKRDTSGLTTQYIATGIVNLGAFAGGVCVAWSSTALPLITARPMEPSPTRDVIAVANSTPSSLGTPYDKLQLTPYEASWAASLLCLGAVFGAVPSGLISEYFGRKKTLLYLALPLLVSWILVASSPNVYGLYVGRFVGGVALGAFSVSIPPYIEDIAEKQILRAMANFYHVHFSCGILFGYIIGLVESTSWLAVLCASVPIAFFVAFIFLPESPAYLLSQAFGATKLYLNMREMVKPGWTLWNFAVACLVGTIFVYFFVPETKGRTLIEIQNEFEGIHKKKKHRHVVEVESMSEA
ncbi:unnamed protein product [Arctia plantaginis]|uniref:Major facilitator superfamily (MFS) profile domain-containing protein n=1 Tax=Arctia plantaginis TaxID=874455 RepID=A0A8S0YUN4_ARCPL|nr:unnamed protein product [Arctia plantaginis]